MRTLILIAVMFIMGLTISIMARASECGLTDKEKIELGREIGNKNLSMVCFGFGRSTGLKMVTISSDKDMHSVVETNCSGVQKKVERSNGSGFMSSEVALELSGFEYPRYSGFGIDLQRRIEKRGDKYVFVMDEASAFDPCKPFSAEVEITCI